MGKENDTLELIKNNLINIESWVSHGATDKVIAEKLGIGYSTFRKYKKECPELKGAITQGKDKANENVEEALYNNAIGFNYYEEVANKVKDEEVIDGQIVTHERIEVVKVKKYSKPDLAAQKFWLINRKNTIWKNDPNKTTSDNKLIKLKEKELEIKKESNGGW